MGKINVDVLVIGSGPSGCVAAASLNKNGFNVKVIEKSVFPRFVIGESLLPVSMENFKEVGLLDCIKAEGFEVKNGARFIRKDEVCEFDFSVKFTEGWDWTWQVPRADFDNALAQEIIKQGVNVSFGHEVVGVQFDENGASETTVKDEKGEEYTVNAKYIIDSSGFGRVLPRLLDLDKASALPEHSSIFGHVKDINRPEGLEGTIITFDIIDVQVWLWVIPFSNGNTSIGFVGPTEYIDSFKGTTAERLSQMLKESDYYSSRFEGVDFLFDPINIKNFSKSVKQLYGNGYILTGNSAEFLDPVFSSGVAFATESALTGAKLIAKSLKGETVDWEIEYSKHIKDGVNVFSTYVKEWYTGNLQKLFFHQPENKEVKKQICAVLAGYVWDQKNPFVRKHDRIVKNLAYLIDSHSEVGNSEV